MPDQLRVRYRSASFTFMIVWRKFMFHHMQLILMGWQVAFESVFT